MTLGKEDAEFLGAGRAASSWIAEVLLTSAYMAGLVCPLCCRIITQTCVVCGAYLCPEHDVACRIARDTICEACWRNNT